METLSGTISCSAGSGNTKAFGGHFDCKKSLLHEASCVR